MPAIDVKTRLTMWLMRTIAAHRKRNNLCPISSVAIEVNQHCNRRCGYCPVSIAPKPVREIDRDLFGEIIRQLQEMRFDGKIKYHFYNEPLLHKELETLVAHARACLPKARNIIYTNGDALSGERARSLFAAGVRQFIVTDHGGRTPTLFVRTAKSRIQFRWSKVIVRTIDAQTFLFNRGGLLDLTRTRRFRYCAYPAYEVIVDISGNVRMCCNDYFGVHSFGNILETPLRQIWESEALAGLRQELLKGIFRLDICRNCVAGTLAEQPGEFASLTQLTVTKAAAKEADGHAATRGREDCS
jgi:GTP 3',8-cyclase